MSHAFADIAFTPAVKGAQTRDGSRASCARNFEGDAEVFSDRLGEPERTFLAAQRDQRIGTLEARLAALAAHAAGPPAPS